ncbi:MMPL family transporter [Phytohabitans sp. ZYX-F-186]|uniref:MMPL family transporter n=1 Tax=Phytohabitans maris TaxID=3071409 RepID=A0ABU0ZJT0_9ACTN|nr:MMPL family transporter [Phytohabitans sp. ZYX-F-186]MDQ7907238.1 MMPL family transporter [Phytohabitans sp. ZYX-F-186]
MTTSMLRPPEIRPDETLTSHRRPRNLAASVARFSARHRATAIGGWLLFVVLATALSAVIGTIGAEDSDYGNGESKRAAQIVDAAGFPERAGEMVIVQSGTLTADSTEFRGVVREAAAAVEATGQVENVNTDAVSEDGHSALVTFDMKGDPETAADRIEPVFAAVAGVQDRHPDLLVAQTGEVSIDEAIEGQVSDALGTLSMLSLPVTLGILIVAFGALLAAVLPLGLAVTAFLASLGLLAASSRFFPADDTVTHLMLLMGLAVGVDYCLFYIRREREERAKGASPEQALATAAATSGRSVLISAFTVIIAMAGMFLTRDTTFISLAVGTILVVATAALGSLTVLPAMLSKLGDKVDLGRIPGLYRRKSDGRFWRFVLRVVLRRPGVSATIAAAALVALALPALGMRPASDGIDGVKHDAAAIKTYDQVQAAFPGGADPATVVVKAPDVTNPAMTAAIADFKAKALATGQLHEPVTVEVNPDRTVARIGIGLSGTGTDKVSEQAIHTLRDDVIPTTLRGVDGADVTVTGGTAQSVDFNHALTRSVPLVFAFVLGLAFVLMLVSFRSVVVAVTAIVLNLLSVAAAYGALTLAFQHGWGAGLMDFQERGTITSWIPLFLFVILFGLSMDYHVFVLSRIREGHDRGWPTRLAVTRGIQNTAGVITSAAVVMVAVFALFTTAPLTAMKEMGFGLAIAVLLDATIVRAVLLPSVMAMLGERNWYLPRWLGWLPRLSHQ